MTLLPMYTPPADPPDADATDDTDDTARLPHALADYASLHGEDAAGLGL